PTTQRMSASTRATGRKERLEDNMGAELSTHTLSHMRTGWCHMALWQQNAEVGGDRTRRIYHGPLRGRLDQVMRPLAGWGDVVACVVAHGRRATGAARGDCRRRSRRRRLVVACVQYARAQAARAVGG